MQEFTIKNNQIQQKNNQSLSENSSPKMHKAQQNQDSNSSG